MPVRWWSSMTGERFLQADRKNRVEKARLDLQLKIYEREKMRNWGLAEKERKVLLTNMESVKRTSGTSNMGVAPEGLKDNYYEKSMHSRSTIRLSEKRLMEWKICERQLQRFLKQKAVPVDEVLLSDSRPLSSRSAWADDSKTSVSAKEKHGGKVEKERNEVQKRVSAFLHNGGHILNSDDNSKNEIKSKGNNRSGRRDSSKEKAEKDMGIQRQRHHSDVVRPHTAHDQTDSVVRKTKRRPASAVVPKKSDKSKFLITKGDVFMECGFRFTKISGQGPETPQAQVNNFVQDLSRSNSTVSLNSDADQDVFVDDRLYASPRASIKTMTPDTEDTRSETKSILSEKGSKKLTKHVSIASFLDQLSEEELEQDFQNAPQSTSRKNNIQSSCDESTGYTGAYSHHDQSTSRYNSAHSHHNQSTTRYSSARSLSATSSKSSLHNRPGSVHPRHRDNSQTPTVLELDDEDEDVVHDNTSKTQRHKDMENPVMYDIHTVNQTVKSAMVFSKSARKRALENLVNQNSPDKREIIRQERLRNMKSRSAMLSTMTRRFNII